MRRFILKSIILLTGLTACLSARAQSYEELWRQVETAQDSGRVGPIGKCLEQVWRKAGKERNFPQRLRALLLQIAYREAVRPRSIYPNMRRIKHWAETCREPADKRVLQMVLSHMYMRKANHRPDTVAHVDTLRADEPDALWTGDRFRKEAMACFDRALADKDLLAHVNARAYEPMVIVGEDSRYFRHDLLSAMAQDVLKWQKHLDERYVLGLYDSLIDYYEEAGNRDAAVLFAYDRIQYLFDRENKAGFDRALDSLHRREEALLAEYADAPAAAYVYERMPFTSWDPAYTYRHMQDALRLHSGYKRADVFRNVLSQLSEPYLTVYLLNRLTTGKPLTCEVNYRNIDTLRVEVLDARTGRSVGADTVCLTPASAPWAYADTVLTLPGVERPGLYKARFSHKGQTREMPFVCNNMDIFCRSLPDDRVQVFVLERTSGRPVPGARVECYATTDLRWRNEENYLLHEYAARPCLTLQTGDDGSATFRPDSTECTIGICAQKAGCGYTDTLRVTLRVREHRPYRDWAGYIKADTLFFNQVLTFHGALYDVCGRKAKPVARHTFDVSLHNDPYPRRHRYKAKVTTDSAGRFRGRFVLPKELRDEVFFLETPYMARNVAFLHKPDTTPRLFELERPADVLVPGDSIRLRGRAWQTDGTPLAHADVNYRITSATSRWTGSRRSTAIQKIFAGQTVTDADGRFTIPLHLKNYHKEPSPEWYMSHRIEVEMPGSDGLRIRRMAYTGSSAIVLNVEGARAWEKGRPAPFQIGAEYLSGWPILSLKGRCVFFRVDDFAPDPFSVKGDSVCAVRFAVGKPFRPSVASRLPSGCYYLEFRAADPLGRTARRRHPVILYSPRDRRLPVNRFGWSHLDRQRLCPDSVSTLLLGTSARDACLMYDVMTSDSVLESRRIVVSDSLLTFRYAYRPEYGDGLTVAWFMLKDGKTFDDYNFLYGPKPESWPDGVPYRRVLPQCPMHKNQLLLKSTRFRFHTPPCRVPEWRLTAWDAVVVQTRTYLPKAEQGTPMENAHIYVPNTGDNPYAKGSPGSASAYVSPSEWDKGIGG